MFEDPFNVSKLVSSTATRRKIAAFIVTSLAVFLACCLVWPVSVTGFRNIAAINVGAKETIQTADNLKPLLAFAIREEMKNGRLESALLETEERTELQADPIEYRDYEKICNAIKMDVQPLDSGYQLKIAYEGEGSPDEQALINVLAERVAFRLSTGRGSGVIDELNPLPDNFDSTNGSLADNGLETDQAFEQADWILEQIEKDLQSVSQTLASIGNFPTNQMPELTAPLEGNEPSSGGSFQLASNKTIKTPKIDEVKQAINSIDVETLRLILKDLKRSTLASQNTKDALSVLNVTQCQSRPINGSPGLGSLLMLLSLSGLVGSIVAWHFDPFEERGFSNPHAVSKALGIPVVALLKTDDEPTIETEHLWANIATKAASWFLLALSLVVVTFLVLNEGVRDAFFTNPFDGMARIVRLFAGY